MSDQPGIGVAMSINFVIWMHAYAYVPFSLYHIHDLYFEKKTTSGYCQIIFSKKISFTTNMKFVSFEVSSAVTSLRF